jgi:hypothetical protein
MFEGAECKASMRDKSEICHLVKFYTNDVQKQCCHYKISVIKELPVKFSPQM